MNSNPNREASAPSSRGDAQAAAPAHLGWRLLAMLYDALPLLALWLLASAVILLLRGGVPIEPWGAAFWLQNGVLWMVSGGYLIGSWHRGGQTLGMRPWRLRVVAHDGRAPGLRSLIIRYVWATVSLLALGLGFLWSLIDSERRTLHDRASNTRLVRVPKPAR